MNNLLPTVTLDSPARSQSTSLVIDATLHSISHSAQREVDQVAGLRKPECNFVWEFHKRPVPPLGVSDV